VRWVIVLLSMAEAGWMAFDGARALVIGDYVTPQSGPYAGQLGPWAAIIGATGLDPRSTGVKLGFLVYGIAWLACAAAYACRAQWAWTAMLVAACASLWYVPVGTALSAIQIVLLLFPAARRS
jgi:hypothetical protein